MHFWQSTDCNYHSIELFGVLMRNLCREQVSLVFECQMIADQLFSPFLSLLPLLITESSYYLALTGLTQCQHSMVT